MIVYVFDKDLEVIGLIEDYYSLTWAERYYVCGDFEMELPISYDSSPLIEFGNFLYIASSDRLMIIEDIKPSTGEDTTNLVVQGESAESLLKRRILLEPIDLNDYAETFIYDIVDDNFSNMTDMDRWIGIIYPHSPSRTTEITCEDQFDRQSIYDVVVTVCKNTGLGFKFIQHNSLDMIAFFVYEGVDRSYSQSTNPFVIFSDDFDNVISSSFYLSEKGKINTVLVFIEDDPTYSMVEVGPAGEPSHIRLDRFETSLETTIDRELEEGSPLTDAEVLAIIKTRGRAVIKENKTVGVFEGNFDIQGNFKYGVDFFMGDIVQCKIEGRNVKARIIELVQSYSTEGETSYIAMDFIV